MLILTCRISHIICIATQMGYLSVLKSPLEKYLESRINQLNLTEKADFKNIIPIEWGCTIPAYIESQIHIYRFICGNWRVQDRLPKIRWKVCVYF